MTLDEKTCWNYTWIVVDNVAWPLGYFFRSTLEEVGLMKVETAHGFQNNLCR